ncbi:MAG: RloB family protein [Planctomycetia bacterium]
MNPRGRELNRRILIVGEGRETEYNYFVGFRTQFAAELQASATSVSIKRGKGGSAMNIVVNAKKEAQRFKPDLNRGDRVFLLMDTEGVGREPELPSAEKIARENRIEIVYSSPAFEYWLLCHFSKIPHGRFESCDAVIVELDKRWSEVSKGDYDKADVDIFKRLSERFNAARAQALQTDLHHIHSNGDARRVNPSTQVYELVAILVGARFGEKCPIGGVWELIENPGDKNTLQKGEPMPRRHWRLASKPPASRQDKTPKKRLGGA